MKAQELPLSTVVIAVLALILVIFIFAIIFNVGGLGNFFAALLSSSTQAMSRTFFAQRCELFCSYAINFDPCAGAQLPDFCTQTADTSDDGGTSTDHCYDDGTGTDVVKECTVKDKCGASQYLNDICETGTLPGGDCCP